MAACSWQQIEMELDEEEKEQSWLDPFEYSSLSKEEEREDSDGGDQDFGGQPIPSLPPPLARIGVNTDKAGMEGLDKTKINQIIVEASKGSRYYQKELEKEKILSQRVQKMLKQLEKFTRSEISKAEREADLELDQLEKTRDLSRAIVHIDMDAFFAAVEIRDNPTLKDVPMAVGGPSMLV